MTRIIEPHVDCWTRLQNTPYSLHRLVDAYKTKRERKNKNHIPFGTPKHKCFKCGNLSSSTQILRDESISRYFWAHVSRVLTPINVPRHVPFFSLIWHLIITTLTRKKNLGYPEIYVATHSTESRLISANSRTRKSATQVHQHEVCSIFVTLCMFDYVNYYYI